MRLELNLESNENVPITNRRTSSIEEVEKKIPKPVAEEKETVFQNKPKHKPDLKRQHRQLARQQSWRQVMFFFVFSISNLYAKVLDDSAFVKNENKIVLNRPKPGRNLMILKVLY